MTLVPDADLDVLRDVARANNPVAWRDALLTAGGHFGMVEGTHSVSMVTTVEQRLTGAIESLQEGEYRQAATILLLRGLYRNTSLSVRRGRASDMMCVSEETFRRRYEVLVLTEVAVALRSRAWVAPPPPALPVDEAEPTPAEPDGSAALMPHLLSAAPEAVVLLGQVLAVKTAGRIVVRDLSQRKMDVLRTNGSAVLAETDAALSFLLEDEPAG